MLIYHSLNPRALSGCNKASLPVIWRANKKLQVMQALFEDWLKVIFIQQSKTTASKNNLTFKALLVLDNAPCHPTALNGLCENVKVVFLPPNTVFATAYGPGHNFNFQGPLSMKNFCTRYNR
jgi:hypothetical protein